MKHLVFACAMSALTAFAATNKKTFENVNPEEVAAKAKAKAAQKAAEEGGILEKKGQSVGKIVFIDTQSAVDKSVVVGAVEKLDRYILRYDVNVTKESAAKPMELKAKTAATIAVILVYDDETPSLLVSPDERWAVVNFKKLDEGLKSEEAKKKFFASRCSKQIQRGFAAACGCLNSSFPGNIASVTKLRDLDLCADLLPVDTVSSLRTSLKALGMKPRRLVFYSTACEEGWAPAPTNAVQKAIWDEVHKLPTKPITIEPEQKK